MKRIVNESQLLEHVPGVTSRELKTLRYKRKIPYLKISYRKRLYDVDAVIAALETLGVEHRK